MVQSAGFPAELGEAVSALSNSDRQRLMLLLLSKRELSYTELQEELRLRKGSLTHHLKKLIISGLVRNYSREKFGGPYESYYACTGFGRKLIVGIYETMKPEPVLSLWIPFDERKKLFLLNPPYARIEESYRNALKQFLKTSIGESTEAELDRLDFFLREKTQWIAVPLSTSDTGALSQAPAAAGVPEPIAPTISLTTRID